MKNLFLLIFMIVSVWSHADWNGISLPHSYIYPSEKGVCGNLGTNVYSTQFPTDEKSWYIEEDCGEYRMTSIRWISDKLKDVKGLSFKGLIYKSSLGDRANEFAVFFHEKRCYNGGAEYGFVYPENSYQGFFYLCGDCNLNHQNWCQWPGDCQAVGDCKAVAKALKNPAEYRYWNIKVLESGDYLIELVDPVSWKYISCTILKPDWFPNLYGSDGYVTINAQKGAEKTADPAPYMHIDEVKIWQ